jgi:flagellar biosynthesis protein FlhB
MADEAAGERTEAATGRRLQKARDAGQVALSREAPTLAVLAAAAMMLVVQAPRSARQLAVQLGAILETAHGMEPVAALRAAGVAVLVAAGPFVVTAALAGTAAVLLQTGGMVNLAALQPDLSRLAPSRGLARIFSLTALLEIGKSLLKLAVAGAVAWSVLSAMLPLLQVSLLWQPLTLLDETSRGVLRILLALLGAQAGVAGFDVLRARLMHASELRMTRQEVRDEHKETDGDPHTKARIKRIRFQRARKRMLRAVPRAAVVITNPTHYAVALAYDRGSTGAPRVVAKGVDAMAARIRDLAREHGVPLVANPPLARALYPLELDSEIPREMFQAVAEIIAYVWGLRRRVP